MHDTFWTTNPSKATGYEVNYRPSEALRMSNFEILNKRKQTHIPKNTTWFITQSRI